jgi:Uma2 family endonuclease
VAAIANVEGMRQALRKPRHWTRLEYERLVDTGFFRPGEPIELIGGQLLVCEPVGEPHAVGAGIAADALRAAFGPGWVVREDKPIALDDESEPEPDLAVAPGAHRDYLAGHPARPVLVVEVAESSLDFDRKQKGSLYARGGITDYWIVNLVDRAVEVYRERIPDPAAAFGWRYRSVDVLRPPATVAPLARPSARLAVTDLLP